jgi:hypothetical protein
MEAAKRVLDFFLTMADGPNAGQGAAGAVNRVREQALLDGPFEYGLSSAGYALIRIYSSDGKTVFNLG